MDLNTFQKKLERSKNPVVVDFWAPWCGPCRVVKPIVEKLSNEYQGKVEFWQINADENPELLRALKIYGIPTMIAYKEGKELRRLVGAKSKSELTNLFEALSRGELPGLPGISTGSRLLRTFFALVVAIAGWYNQAGWVVYLLAALLLFLAVYDLMPLKLLSKIFQRSRAR